MYPFIANGKRGDAFASPEVQSCDARSSPSVVSTVSRIQEKRQAAAQRHGVEWIHSRTWRLQLAKIGVPNPSFSVSPERPTYGSEKQHAAISSQDEPIEDKHRHRQNHSLRDLTVVVLDRRT